MGYPIKVRYHSDKSLDELKPFIFEEVKKAV